MIRQRLSPDAFQQVLLFVARLARKKGLPRARTATID
jgi:hypothetical protein